MCMQEGLLSRLRVHLNELTLKEISSNTGIQITRVFRILNGYEMKISEYEKIENFLASLNKGPNYIEHIKLYKTYLEAKGPSYQRKLEDVYHHTISLKNLLKRNPFKFEGLPFQDLSTGA